MSTREWSLRVVGDDTTRVAEVYDEHGYLVTTRPYNDDENAAADERLQAETEAANREQVSSKLITVDFPKMQLITDQTPRQLSDDPGHEIKDLARAVRRLIRKVESLADGSD